MSYHRLKTDQNGFVTGYGSSKTEPKEGEVYPHIMTDAEYQLWGGQVRLSNGGDYRWKIENDQLIEQVDNRPLVRFTPDVINEPEGIGSTSVTIEIVENGVVNTKFTKLVEKEISWKGKEYPLNLQFNNGVCVVSVSHSEAHISQMRSNNTFLTESPLQVRIYKTEL